MHEIKNSFTGKERFIRIALMCDDVRLAKITTKPWFENANFTLYHVLTPKAAKMKRIPM